MIAATARCSSAGTPAAYSRRRAKKGWKPIAGSRRMRASLRVVDGDGLDVHAALVESMNSGALAPRSNVTEK